MSKNATISHTLACYKDIGTLIKGSTILKGIRPCCSSTHIYLSFVEIHHPSLAINDLTYSEMAIIFGVIKESIRSKSQHQIACFCGMLLHCFKVNIYPITILSILNFTCNRIHSSLNIQATSYIYEENITTSAVCNPTFPHAYWGLWNTHSTSIGIHSNILSYPIYQQSRILSKAYSLFCKCLFKELLEWFKYHFTLNTW